MAAAPSPTSSSDRLYQTLARALIAKLFNGKYAVGDRLPAERELSIEYDVSRPTVREAIIALEVQGLVDVRVGSGAYVKRLPGKTEIPGFNITAFELTEARLLFEGEAAALAASQITDEELNELDALVRAIAAENLSKGGSERADRAFHLSIAAATRNTAIVNTIKELWNLRANSPESALLHEKARTANIKPVDPVSLGLVGQIELDALVRKAADKKIKDDAKRGGATLQAVDAPVEDAEPEFVPEERERRGAEPTAESVFGTRD